MPSTNQSIAERLQQALAEGVDAWTSFTGGLYGETVTVSHSPPLPTDGVSSGVDLLAAARAKDEEMRGLVSDQRFEDILVQANDDGVRADMTAVGTLTSGEELKIKMQVVYRIDNGRIVSVTSDSH